jgi:hypothetical protein
VVEIYTADSVGRWLMTEIRVFFIRPQWPSPYFIWRQIYIFKDHNVWNIWKRTCYSCTYLIIINSGMIFIFSVIFLKPFLRYKIDPMPLRCRLDKNIIYWIILNSASPPNNDTIKHNCLNQTEYRGWSVYIRSKLSSKTVWNLQLLPQRRPEIPYSYCSAISGLVYLSPAYIIINDIKHNNQWY